MQEWSWLGSHAQKQNIRLEREDRTFVESQEPLPQVQIGNLKMSNVHYYDNIKCSILSNVVK